MGKDWTVTTKETPAMRMSPEDVRAIVAAGMSITEARMLLDDGYTPDLVLGIAQEQAAQKRKAAEDAQKAQAKAFHQAQRPENEQHPGFSVFAHPDGDVAHPKTPLPFEVWHNNYPIHKFPETETYTEWELYRQLTPGEITVLRRDGSTMRVTIEAKKNANGVIESLRITYPVLHEERWLEPPKSVLLAQLINRGDPRTAFIESYAAHMATVTPQFVNT